MVFRSTEVADQWDTWCYHHDGTYYLYYLISGDCLGEGFGVASSPDGVHWQVDNLSVHDGSVFPTSIGANPQLSIYGMTNLLATQLVKRLNGKDVVLA